MSIPIQFYLLQYKSWKLQFRKKIVTALEIIIPLALCAVMLGVRSVVKNQKVNDATLYGSYSVDSWSQELFFILEPKYGDTYGLGYTPKTAATDSIMSEMRDYLEIPNFGISFTTQGFETEDKMVEHLTFSNTTLDNEKIYLAGIVFDNPEEYKKGLPFNISYTIRTKYNLRAVGYASAVWSTKNAFPGQVSNQPAFGNYSTYFTEGFLTIQHALHKSVLNILNPDWTKSNISLEMEQFPSPPYSQDIFITIIKFQLPLIIILSFIFHSLMIPKEVTYEKQMKLKESMRMMGMANWLQWTSWFFKYFVFMFFITLLMSLILSPPSNARPELLVLANSNFSVVWIFFLLYAMCLVSYCFLISSIFNKANVAAAVGGIIYFLLFIPFYFITTPYDNLSTGVKLASCLDFNIAMSLGMVIIGDSEETGAGVQWGTLNTPPTVDDNFAIGQVMLMLFIDTLLHTLAMWYIDAVFPGTYGVAQPPYFFVLPSYWCGTRSEKVGMGSKIDVEDIHIDNSGYFEPDPVNLNAGIKIKGLTKKFKSNGLKKVAVNNLNLNMYDGQITALLGHNGAGKTTTMFMLTGFMPPSSGTAVINGFDIRKDLGSVRSSLGLCPQHDILFDELTVEEHLYFFAKLKRCPADKISSQIDYYVDSLGLTEKKKAFAHTLSGGQKRKLSVGIALIGDSKIVILDEPTSGMDPSARRHMWDLLQSQRAGRTILLTTHFMDEADHLGDRIAILADGVVQCCGSSLFLKKKYGAGYHMIMTKDANCDVEKVEQLLTKHVPEAVQEADIGAELSFILPDDKVSAFPQLFTEIEEKKESLGILGFGASVTTMEEVFMKVGENHKDPDDEANEEPEASVDTLKRDVPEDRGSVVKNTGAALFAQQFKAMLFKRMIYSWRNKVLSLSQLLLPVFFTSITIILLKLKFPTDPIPKRDLNINMFGTTETFYDPGDPVTAVSGDFIDQFTPLAPDHTVKQVGDVITALLEKANTTLKEFNYNTVMTLQFSDTIRVLYNYIALHAAPVALLYADQAVLHHFVNDSYTFAAANNPLPQTENAKSKIKAESAASDFSDAFTISFNLMFGLAFLATSFVVFLITERTQKIKHSQIVSGVKWYNFWLSTFTWDFINFMIPALVVVILFAIADIKNYTDIKDGNAQPIYIIGLMIIYGSAILPMMYAMQFAFSGAATGYVVMVFYNLVTGIFPSLIVDILLSIEETKKTAKTVDWVFIILFPNYNLAKGLSKLYSNYDYLDLCFKTRPKDVYNMTPGKDSLKKICDDLPAGEEDSCCKGKCGDNCIDYQANYYAWQDAGIGKYVVFLLIQAAVCWIVIILIESEVLVKLIYKIRPKVVVTPNSMESDVDDDVRAEKEKILNDSSVKGSESNQVVISGLTKYFGNHKAVEDVYVSIPKGECFGLLGVNGAGKTTSFRMLTGDETISGGTAYMNGKNIKTDIHEVQKSIGYCPQFDALIDQLTGEEMLYMYARMRGIPEKSIGPIADELINALLLTKHRKKLTREYSGGNKRKLSTAIALIGDSPIVFLDEPTTGLDPVARRMLWKTLTKDRERGKTLILTSHSMEECEALCTRMTIMVNGKYRCLGSTQHLKNKFGAGYTLIARIGYPEDGSFPDIQPVKAFVEQNFPNAQLKDSHQNSVQYDVPRGDLSWAVIFEKMESVKQSLNIEDYSVSQTTLEQIFMNFARAQVAPDESQPGCASKITKVCCTLCSPEYVMLSTD